MGGLRDAGADEVTDEARSQRQYAHDLAALVARGEALDAMASGFAAAVLRWMASRYPKTKGRPKANHAQIVAAYAAACARAAAALDAREQITEEDREHAAMALKGYARRVAEKRPASRPRQVPGDAFALVELAPNRGKRAAIRRIAEANALDERNVRRAVADGLPDSHKWLAALIPEAKK